MVGGRITCGGAHDAINVVAPDGRVWKAISDGSLSSGAEFVTPILGWDDLETYQECIRAIRRAGAKTPATTNRRRCFWERNNRLTKKNTRPSGIITGRLF